MYMPVASGIKTSENFLIVLKAKVILEGKYQHYQEVTLHLVVRYLIRLSLLHKSITIEKTLKRQFDNEKEKAHIHASS